MANFSVMLFNLFMDTIEETRLKRLHILKDELRNECKTDAAFAEKIGKSESQLSQWIKRSPDSKTGKPRNISSQIAREIEILCKKPRGWMDQPVVDETKRFLDALETIRAMPKEKVAVIKEEFPESRQTEVNKKIHNH
ncbi:MAG: hypothetical protein K2P74_01610 [Nitrosomonas sp.]|nr:hypothetical protein [Nitrosomonas sp.]